MRNGLTLALVCLVTACMGTAIGNSALNKTASVKVGYLVAERCLADLNLYRDLNIALGKPAACVYADYEEADSVIVIGIFGTMATAEAARVGINTWWKWLESHHLSGVQKEFGLTLGVDDYTIVYYNLNAVGEQSEVIRREKGQFVIPR